MNFKHTWLWLLMAGGLLAFILFFQRHGPLPPASASRILPGLKPTAVTSVQIAARGQLPLRVERTNDTWQLTEPLPYPAQSASVEMLLSVLEQLTPARHFTQTELPNRFEADKTYGFTDPQATILLGQPGESFPPVRIGSSTAPGDQVFVQVVGRDEIYVVDAAMLRFIPRAPSEWRDTSFIRLRPLAFDSLTVASGNSRLSFQTDPVSHLWRMTAPFDGRADNEKLTGFLQALERSRIQQFVSDQTNVDLEPFGLQPPEHELVFKQGTNDVCWLQFGKSPTNDATRVYARRSGRNGVVSLPKEVLLPWRASMQMNDYRDPFLLHVTEPVTTIDVRAGEESFSLQCQASNNWRVLPQGFPADTGLVNEFLAQLNHIKVVEFTGDNILESALPKFGLAPPLREFILKTSPVGAAGAATNTVLADVSFGLTTNRAEVFYARRADEKSVYAVPAAEVRRLPVFFAYQMRERRVFHFSINDVTGATLVQDKRVRQLKRNGPHSWSLAPGSEGVINDLAVEETVKGLCQMSAAHWAPPEKEYRAQFGLVPPLLKITLDLKNGDQATVELGKPFGPTQGFAAVTLEGQPWVFEFPANLLNDVLTHLSVP
jgi:hypothetical protein